MSIYILLKYKSFNINIFITLIVIKKNLSKVYLITLSAL